MVREKQEASASWLYDYDGLDPPPEALVAAASPGKQCEISGMSNCDNDKSAAGDGGGGGSGGASPPSAASPHTAASSGYTSLNNHPTAISVPENEEEDEREFWEVIQ